MNYYLKIATSHIISLVLAETDHVRLTTAVKQKEAYNSKISKEVKNRPKPKKKQRRKEAKTIPNHNFFIFLPKAMI